MRPGGVVVLGPRSDRRAGLIEGEEQGLVQQLVPHLAIETLDVAVLHGLPRHDVVPLDPLILRPGEDGVRGELGPVVADDQAGPTSAVDESRQLPRDSVSGHRGVRDGRQALVGDIIDDIEDPEAPAVGHLIVHEVQ